MIQKATQIPRDLQAVKFKIDSAFESEKNNPESPQKYFPFFHFRHLADHLRPTFGREMIFSLEFSVQICCGLVNEI
jgi:hypothetical protein